jgi:hypothetical protein
VPVYVLHSLGDTLCQASASKHFQTIHTNPLSKFVYPEQGKHELLQEVTMWKVATRCYHKPLLCVALALYPKLTTGSSLRCRPMDGCPAAARVMPHAINRPPTNPRGFRFFGRESECDSTFIENGRLWAPQLRQTSRFIHALLKKTQAPRLMTIHSIPAAQHHRRRLWRLHARASLCWQTKDRIRC